jgi:hypothetical protein
MVAANGPLGLFPYSEEGVKSQRNPPGFLIKSARFAVGICCA